MSAVSEPAGRNGRVGPRVRSQVRGSSVGAPWALRGRSVGAPRADGHRSRARGLRGALPHAPPASARLATSLAMAWRLLAAHAEHGDRDELGSRPGAMPMRRAGTRPTPAGRGQGLRGNERAQGSGAPQDHRGIRRPSCGAGLALKRRATVRTNPNEEPMTMRLSFRSQPRPRARSRQPRSDDDRRDRVDDGAMTSSASADLSP